MDMEFYICRHCGNIIAMVKSSGVPVMCCGEPMQRLVPGTVEAAREKHIPVLTRSGAEVTVQVGSVAHPMQPEHFIEWIALKTRDGNQRKALRPGEAPRAVFCVPADDPVEAVFAYCNLHGLWQA